MRPDRYSIDWSLKVYTQLARERVVLTQDGDTELSLSFIIQPSSGSSWRFMQGSNRRNKPPIPPAECPLIPYT